MSGLSARSLRRRFLALSALRWLPVGLIIPITVLLPLERGLSLGEVGLAVSVQGLVVLALELPTGGLADSVGRRRVLLLAAGVGVVSTGLYLVADTAVLLTAVFALQGVYRALDSGPLEAWYVDAAMAVGGHAPIDRALSAQGVVVGLAIAGGALLSGALVVLDPVPVLDALAVPVAASLLLQVLGLAGIAVLMVETPMTTGARAAWRAAARTPRAIADGVSVLRHNRVLLALVAVELTWGFGMVAFETLTPVRLAEIVGGEAAAAITGPASSAAWLLSAAGAAALPWVGRRLGLARTAALMRVVQGVTVVGIGLFTGVVGVVTAYLACYVVNGASDPAHQSLLHRQVHGPQRATVLSLSSMASQPAGSLGVIALTWLADGLSVGAAMIVGAVVLAVAAPLYLPAWRQERRAEAAGTPPPLAVAARVGGEAPSGP
ncbi:MFS transporter [Georgenia sp. SYP-B2076]|uniref:MFS transporter n=1 Tax=Georgenia sp. SYP-B2076 TaxID=2495881 RepID=UPI000F8CBFA0|nr:MFS transporter [Georgenia sp. SYP-B2076]